MTRSRTLNSIARELLGEVTDTYAGFAAVIGVDGSDVRFLRADLTPAGGSCRPQLKREATGTPRGAVGARYG